MMLLRHEHSRAERGRAAFWASRGVAALLLGTLLQLAQPALLGTAGARIYVRWAASVDDAARARLERDLRLDEGRVHEGTTWTYALRDVSTDHIRAIVNHPAVADTHKVNRNTFELSPDAERTARQGGLVANGDRVAPLLNGAVTILVLLGSCALALAALSLRGWPEPFATGLGRVNDAADRSGPALRAAPRRALDAMQRGIPVVEARTAGIFRAVFGALLLVFLVLHPLDASWLANPDTVQVTGSLHGVVLGWLSPHPWLVDRIWVIALALGVSFTIGLFTPWTFTAFVTVFLLWATVYVAHRGSHTSTAISLALVALLPSRWGDGFSVDALLRRTRTPASAAGASYGYSAWVLSLVLGLCFAAAAWSKVKDGVAWVANGTVAFHFITDAPQALVSWGLWIARSYPLAVAFSLGAVIVEALVITAAFRRSIRFRAAAGLGAMSLLAGFALFQGVIWPMWWLLLLGFLPWERLRTRPGTTATAAPVAVSRAQLFAIVLLIAQQLVVSGAGAEVAPLFSAYDMYSATYASREAYDRTRPTTYRLVDMTGEGHRELSCRVEGAFAAEFQKLAAGEAADRSVLADGLRDCSVAGGPPRRLALVGDRRRFDWNRGELITDRAATIVGPVSLALQ